MTEDLVPQNGLSDAGELKRPDALARLGFGDVPAGDSSHMVGARHLAFLPPEALELDLDDPDHCQFGDYHLLEKLGQGGMGVVYRARQLSLDRDVAVKLLSAGPWASSTFIERFRREAQSAARMQHPNIVAIFEIGSQDELNFFSMRLVRGQSLAQLLAEGGPLTPRKAAALLRTIAEALDYAHRLGVLHLDLKPANVLIDERGEPQVADFGLARRMDETLASDNDEVSGTPSYMAPEQAQVNTHKLSPATDIYGLGAILYELLTGTPPFDAPTPHETLSRVAQQQAVPPRRLKPAVPRDLDAICLKCLEKDPALRYATARDLAEDLGRFLEGRQVRARPLHAGQRALRWGRREPRVAIAVSAALVALLLGLAATTAQWRRADASAEVARANAAAARATAWAQRRTAMWQSFDRNAWQDALPLLVANLREQEAAGALDEAAAERRRLGILLAASPQLIDVIALGSPISVVALSPDGTHIAAMTRVPASESTELWSLHFVDADAGRVLWRIEFETSMFWVRFSADGRSLHVESRPGQDFDGYGDGNVVLRIDAASGATLPPPEVALHARMLAFSRDGAAAMLVDPGGKLWTWRADTSAPGGLLRDFEPGARAMLSEDGGTVAYAPVGDRTRLELYEVATGHLIRTFALPHGESMTAWRLSADGHWLAIASDAGELSLHGIRDGSARTFSKSCEASFNRPAFSSDATWLASTCTGTRTTIWQVSDGRVVSQIQHTDYPYEVEIDPAHRSVFAQELGQPKVYRLPRSPNRLGEAGLAAPILNGGTERNLEAGAFDPALGLLAVGTRNGSLKLWRMPRSPVLPISAPPLSAPDLYFDGEHVVGVNGNEARVVGARQGEALGPPLVHPQPIGFADFADGGASVVTSSGLELRVWDWRRGEPRFMPLSLPNSPLRVIVAPDGASVLTSVGAYRDGHFVESLRLWRAADGKALGEAEIPGPLEGARYSTDGRRLITWRGDTLATFDGRTLAGPLLSLRHRDESGNPVNVIEARMGASDEVHVTTRRRNINYIAYYWRWDESTGELRERLPLASQGHRFALSPGGGFAAYGLEFGMARQSQRRSPGESLEWLPQPHLTIFGPGLAYSPDGRLLAQAPLDGAMLVDPATNVALSPPLRVPSPANEGVVQLAFAPAGDGLLARTAAGRWLSWDVAPDTRPLPVIESEEGLYAPRTGIGWIDAAPELAPVARAALRARDSGAPLALEDATEPDPNTTFPTRPVESSPQLLDLSAYYTPVEMGEVSAWDLFDLRSVPRGVQRLLGVDFDIRGLVQLAGETKPNTPQAFPSRIDGIALPTHAQAIDLLLGEYGYDDQRRVVLEVVLVYRDGGERRVDASLTNAYPYSFQLEPDALGEPEAWRGARIAWLGQLRNNARLLRAPAPLFLLRVRNPEPLRELRSLSLVARTAPYIVAITAHATLPHEVAVP